jgi:putative hydrolase of the HAD superfamily
MKLILFDLDETLYPRSAALMQQISQRITQYMVEKAGVSAEQANELRAHFRGTYGTALRGLMEEGHPIDVEDYCEMLLGIPLRRAVLTNSNIEHAERILRHMNIYDCFERVIDIRALGFKNKPDPLAYTLAMKLLDVLPEEVIFVEDTPVNTRAAKAIGMTTILIECAPSDAADYFLDSVMEVGPLVSRLRNMKVMRADDNDPISG